MTILRPVWFILPLWELSHATWFKLAMDAANALSDFYRDTFP
jgi:hypothetical protein